MFPLLAQEAVPQAKPVQQPGGFDLSILLPMAGIILIWWLLVMRPQAKAEKARRAKLDAIAKGDTVRTRGGIEGVVVRVQDDKVVLKIDTDGKVHVPFSKSYIEEVLTGDKDEASKSS
jgi:preprotein translocase subunit YajC